jgi:pimeloyl-ACP methyl ester carboxylesterase
MESKTSAYPLEHQFITVNGLTLHMVQMGSKDGPLVLLLHGFPEYWWGMKKQMPALAEAGYWVWAPDQRGYNLSDKPRGVSPYQIDKLAADIIELIDAAERKKAIVIGHDWGGAVAWWLGIHYPERLEKLVLLNMPHPQVAGKHLLTHPLQLIRSSYAFFFQTPWLPEFLSSHHNWALVVRGMQLSARTGTFSEQDMKGYRQAWSRPGAFTAMLNWYRAALRHPPDLLGELRVTVPTLMIWGAQDAFLGREMAEPSIELCDEGRLVFIEEATHWVQHEEPGRVNGLIRSFLGERNTDEDGGSSIKT